jgi:NAD/NADP transhydrogenase beta subunit
VAAVEEDVVDVDGGVEVIVCPENVISSVDGSVLVASVGGGDVEVVVSILVVASGVGSVWVVVGVGFGAVVC